VLIGGPWRPPFPWPLPNGADDLDGKPLFITIKQASPRPPKAYVGRLQRNLTRGEWEVAWYGEKGAPPEVVPATVEQVGEFGDTARAKICVKFSFNRREGEVDIIIFTKRDCKTITAEFDLLPSIHVRAPLPQKLPGREINSSTDPDVQGFASKLKDICCGKPKPFPPDWPPLILFRNDVSVVVVPYDNPKVREAQSLDDLIGQDIGFVYVRKKPFPGGTTTDCGPNGVWCPPREEPFYNVRVIREREAIYDVRFTKLGNPSQVVATLPAEVAVEPSDGREISIMDSIDSPNEPVLKVKWPKITIIIIKIER